MSNPPGKMAGSSPATGDVKTGKTSKKLRQHKGLVIGVATSLALALGGGAAWALGDTSTDIESRLPGSTAAFASFNLDVSKEQQIKMLELAAKFPASAVNSDVPQEAVSQFLGMLEEHDGEFANGMFSEWVGPNASVALWEHDDQPYGLATVSSFDDTKAEDGLAKLKEAGGTDQVGFEIKDGYATIAFGESGAQEAAKSAVAEAEETPLSGSDRFAQANEFLGEDQVLSAWADLEESYALLKAQGSAGGPLEHLPFDQLEGLEGNAKGQFAIGAKAQDYGIEAVSSTFGAENVPEGKEGLLDEMSQLPQSDVAAALAVPEDFKNSIIVTMLEGFTGIGSGIEGPVLDKIYDALSGTSGAIGVKGVVGPTPSGTGIVETNSPDKALMLKSLGDLTGVLDTSVDGNIVTASTRGFSGDGKISDNEYYADAVGGAVENSNAAAFFDVQQLLTGEAKQVLAAVKAVGLTQGSKGGESVGNYRVIIA